MEITASFTTTYTWKLPEGLTLHKCDYRSKRYGAYKRNAGKWSCSRGKIQYIDADGKEQIIEASCEGTINVPNMETFKIG
jgi:hypothetical protein